MLVSHLIPESRRAGNGAFLVAWIGRSREPKRKPPGRGGNLAGLIREEAGKVKKIEAAD